MQIERVTTFCITWHLFSISFAPCARLRDLTAWPLCHHVCGQSKRFTALCITSCSFPNWSGLHILLCDLRPWPLCHPSSCLHYTVKDIVPASLLQSCCSSARFGGKLLEERVTKYVDNHYKRLRLNCTTCELVTLSCSQECFAAPRPLFSAISV